MQPLENFVKSARIFLDSKAEKRDERLASAQAVEDRVALFRGSTEQEVAVARAWQRSAFDAGFGWISGPADEGGAGLSGRYERAYLALEREYDVASRGPLSVSLGMVAPTLLQYGSDEVRAQWLKPLRRGDAVGCQLFSEPGAGSDLAGVTTAAIQGVDGNWVLDGQKVWTSGAHYSDIGVALTRTAPGPRHKNLTAFVVDMRDPGVEVRPLRQMTGGADFNEVFLSGARVPDTNRLGEVGSGWTVALAMLSHERNAIGGASTGGTGLFKMEALSAWLREIGRADDPAVAQAFARVYCGVTAAKGMRARAEARAKAGELPGPEMSLGKLALTNNLTALSDLVMLALGSRGLADTGEIRTFAWTEFVLGVPGMRIGGGTDEIQRNIIAERVLGLPKDPVQPGRSNEEQGKHDAF